MISRVSLILPSCTRSMMPQAFTGRPWRARQETPPMRASPLEELQDEEHPREADDASEQRDVTLGQRDSNAAEQ
jgi:hypothetical protein